MDSLRQHLEEELQKDVALLKQLEDARRNVDASEPRLINKLNDDIKQLKQQIQDREVELESIAQSQWRPSEDQRHYEDGLRPDSGYHVQVEEPNKKIQNKSSTFPRLKIAIGVGIIAIIGSVLFLPTFLQEFLSGLQGAFMLPSFEVKPGSIDAGDSLTLVKSNGEEFTVRFCGIDAPDKEQPLGIEARNYLRSLINRSTNRVTLKSTGKDPFDRIVGELHLQLPTGEPLFLNGEMVKAGLAWHDERHSDSCPSKDVLVSQEAIAKSQQLGIHKPGNIPPWEWRQRNE
ncbi:MAG: thermonuclease family protein [Oscillatoria sp. PMC 1068.18]|nr:thermonuclease family protein [Oscillatoria sp. PMC 1068.18]